MRHQDAQRHHIVCRARQLRRDATEAEKKLWFHLRSRQVAGVKLRRQVSIGAFVADFCSFEAKLIVEVDGGQHADQEEADLQRSRLLARSGYRVIRFWNNDVLENVEGVLWAIEKEVLSSLERSK
jgi:very-short-patch-repair endonuclease